MSTFAFWIVVFMVVFALFRVASRKRVVKDPRLGFLDLSGGESAPLVTEDSGALRDLFMSTEVSTDSVPICDVLFLYATLETGGELGGTGRYLRATIRDSGAKIVVVASENPKPPMSSGPPTYGRANLVITLERKGDSFPRFFKELFGKMKNGTSMPMAWVRLAPQNPNLEHEGCPATIFACELGGLSFK